MTPDQLLALRDAIKKAGLDRRNNQFNPIKSNEDRLIEMLSVVNNDDHIELMIDFISNYKIITEYREYISKFLDEISRVHEGRVAIVPLIKHENYTRGSGPVVAYDMGGLAAEYGYKFQIFDTPWSGKGLSSGLPKYIVDDFIGSGEQFLGMYDRIRKDKKPDFSVAGVFCVASMRQGKMAIEARGITVHCSVICDKAIEVYEAVKGHDLVELYKLYDALETPLQVHDEEKRGRAKSEGLISLKRTPNNTLPIFWNHGRDQKWPAPFPRT